MTFGEDVLLLSDPWEHGPAGLHAYDGDSFTEFDRLATSGLACVGDSRVARLVRTAVTALLVYDKRGVERYHRLDDVADPHDVASDGTCFVIASTGRNSIVWLDESGGLDAVWRAEGQGDAWHLNSLLWHHGVLHVCMFGRFVTHRGWEGETAGAGLVFRWPDCEPLLDGLDAPHTPRFVDGSWLVCNSNRNELLRFDESGRNIEARLELRSWPRGIAVRDGHLFVGESAERGPDNVGEATIAVVDLDEWKVVDRVEAPVREIYDLVFVPRSFADGIATGFSANSSLQWHSLTGMPLGSSDLRVSVEARIPAELPSATTIYVDCEIENLGSACFISAPPSPVHASYRWLTLDGAPLPAEAEPSRTPLPVPLHPGAALPLPVLVRTPVATGPHRLRITLVQEGVSWFDELDHSSCAEASVVLRGPNG